MLNTYILSKYVIEIGSSRDFCWCYSPTLSEDVKNKIMPEHTRSICEMNEVRHTHTKKKKKNHKEYKGLREKLTAIYVKLVLTKRYQLF